MRHNISNRWLAVFVLLLMTVIGKADNIELKSQIENATVEFYALNGNDKGDKITSVAIGTEYVLADIQPAAGYWTELSMLQEPESLADIGSANARRKVGSTDLVSFLGNGTIEAFGETQANGGGLYKLGITAIEGVNCIVLNGTVAAQTAITAATITITAPATGQTLDKTGSLVIAPTDAEIEDVTMTIAYDNGNPEAAASGVAYTATVTLICNDERYKFIDDTEVTIATAESVANKTVSTDGKTLSVDAAFAETTQIVVKVKDATRKYGAANPTFEYEVTGGEIEGEPVISTEADATTGVGDYTITIAKGTVTPEGVQFDSGTLTIEGAPLTITADDKSKTYGEDNPTLTCSYSGFVNDETVDVVTTKPTLAATATAASNVGTYDITVSGAVAANYEISYAKGTLTVNPKSITLSISLTPNPATYTYDESEKQPTVSVTATGISSLTDGTDYTLSGTLKATNADTYTITATPAGNYTGSAVSAEWTINPRTSEDAAGNEIEEDGNDVILTVVGDNPVDDDGGLVIPDNVTKIDNNAFDNMSADEKASVQFVDLSDSNVSGLTVDRGEGGVFEGFSENAIICLPAGNNDGGEANVVIGSTCQELKLTDDVEQTIPIDFTANKVTYNRSLTANDTYTLCLSYSLTSDDKVTYYELSDVSGSTLIFNQVTATIANKPYLAVPKAAGASFGKQVSTAVSSNASTGETAITGYKMVGTMKRINRNDAIALGAYILQDNNEWKPVTTASPATVYIPPYRGYIVGTTGAARLQTAFDDNGDPTGIKNILTIDADGNENWYDMNGRKLPGKPVGKGAYIVNGKKVTIKK